MQQSIVGVESDCLGDGAMSARLENTTAALAVAQRLLMSNKDTVNLPVNKDTMECTFKSCPYNATDHWSGTQEELLFVLEEHMRTEHPIPTVELVEGYISREAWDALRDWWSNYREVYGYYRQVYGSERMFVTSSARVSVRQGFA